MGFVGAMRNLQEARLYAFVDADYLAGRDPAELARRLAAGGADIIQLRAKTWPPEKIKATGERLLEATEAQGIPLVINDHPNIAREIGASFCHLGQEDFFGAGRRAAAEVTGVPPAFRLGLSSHAPEQAERAVAAGAAYVATGPVYATPTKPGRPAAGLGFIRWAAENLRLPWFAIGGITLANLEEVLAAGARRVCAVSAILKAPDPEAVCRQFKERLASVPL